MAKCERRTRVDSLSQGQQVPIRLDGSLGVTAE